MAPQAAKRDNRAMHPSWQLNLRRSIFRVLLQAARPLPVHEITRRLREDEGWDEFPTLGKVVAGMLRYQVTKGRVERTRWGVYRIVPERFSRTTRWRIMNWDR